MSGKISIVTCPHCGKEVNALSATKHIAVCAKRPSQRELVRMYEQLGQYKLVAAKLGVSTTTVHRWLNGRDTMKCEARLEEIHEREPVYPIDPERFGQWGGCDASCDHWQRCQELPAEWPTPCMAVTASDVRLLATKYGWPVPDAVAEAVA